MTAQPVQRHSPSAPPRVHPEKLTDIPINNGHDKATLVREVDPKGAIVVHAVKKSSYVHDRMHNIGHIDNEQYDAAERFRKDFERAHLEGRMASIDLFRSSGGTPGEMSDAVMEARLRVKAALGALARRTSGKSISQSCVWFVVGCGETLEQWSRRMRNSGENMSEGKASGWFCGSLEHLAFHYGISNARTIKERATKLAEVRAKNDAFHEVITLAELSALDPQMSLLKFTDLLKKKVEKLRSVG